MKEQINRLKLELEHLDRAYKAGIMKEKEFSDNKAAIEKKIKKLEQKMHNDEQSRKIISDILDEKPKEKKILKPIKKNVQFASESVVINEDSKMQENKERTVKHRTVKQQEDLNLDGWSIAVYILTILFIMILLFFSYKYTQNAQITGKQVTIYEYSDYACEYCKQVQPTLKQLKEYYKDNIRIIHKNFPLEELNPGATFASEVAECANKQGRFQYYEKELYERQNFLKNVSYDPGELQDIASDLSLNMDLFKACQKSHETNINILQDIEEGKSKGVISTPTFFIGNTKLVGAQSFEVFKYYIEIERKR
ncbi:thioredoxin domain-containing protein [Candidatus Woesearchaeota archaeon]|nr:thioredoxin domain-containing protein [Candidatus Woesearchaeota archaeon]